MPKKINRLSLLLIAGALLISFLPAISSPAKANTSPTVIWITPTSGSTLGGTSVEINGTNFNGVTGVYFGSTRASIYTINSSDQIIATSPAGNEYIDSSTGRGIVHITVTTTSGTSSTSTSDQFTYLSNWTDPGNYNPVSVGSISINSAADLAGFAKNVNTGSSYAGYTVTLNNDLNLSGHNWVPIGSGAVNSFQGIFDGNGHTISGLNLYSTDKMNIGLFGYTLCATIKNIELAGGSFTAYYYHGINAGSLVGLMDSTSLLSCSSSSNITVSSGVGQLIKCGGLAGEFWNGTGFVNISRCAYTSGTIEVAGTEAPATMIAGGLFGNVSGAIITNCSSNGHISSTIGGTVTKCAGGLIGALSCSKIYNSYSATQIILSGSSNDSLAAGMIGHCNINTLLSNCYTSGSISAVGTTLFKGALIGLNEDYNMIITDCYWQSGLGGSSDYNEGGIGSNNGATVNSLTMLTSNQLKNIGTIGSTNTTYKTTGSGSSYTSSTILQALNAVAMLNGYVPWLVNESINNGYPYLNTAPVITSISPSSGPISGGTRVTINGANFSGVTGVCFGSTAAASYTVASPTQIIAISPANSAGIAHITVLTATGSSNISSSDQFTYTPVNFGLLTALDGYNYSADGQYIAVTKSDGYNRTFLVKQIMESGVATHVSPLHFLTQTPGVYSGSIGNVTPRLIAYTINSDGSINVLDNIKAKESYSGLIYGSNYLQLDPSYACIEIGGNIYDKYNSFFTSVDTQYVDATKNLAYTGFSNVPTTQFNVPSTSLWILTQQDVFNATKIFNGISQIGSNYYVPFVFYENASYNPNGSSGSPEAIQTSKYFYLPSSGRNTFYNGNGELIYEYTGWVNGISKSIDILASLAPKRNTLYLIKNYEADGITISEIDSGVVLYNANNDTSPITTQISNIGNSSITLTDYSKSPAAVKTYNITHSTVYMDITAAPGHEFLDPSAVLKGYYACIVADPATSQVFQVYVCNKTAPYIYNVSPSTGSTVGGASVTINGINFGNVMGVYFGGISAAYNVGSGNQITAVAPAGSAGTVDITVVTANGTSSTSAADKFTYVAPTYTISSISNQTLTAITDGYRSGSQETKTITITKTGTGDLENLSVALSGANSSSFTITQPSATTLNSSTTSTTFTLKAKNGLAEGTYTATVTVSASNMSDVTFTVTQVVNSDSSSGGNNPGGGIGGGGGGIGGGGGGGGGAGGGTPSGGSNSTSSDSNTTKIGIEITGTTDTITGTTNASVSDNIMSALAQNASTLEKSGQQAVVEIQVSTANSTSASVQISASAINNIANTTNAAVSVNTGIATVTFDSKAVDSISGAVSAGNVNISIASVDRSSLSQQAKDTVGDRPVYDFSVTAAGSRVSAFGGGNVSIGIPYIPAPNEDRNAIVVFYIDEEGTIQNVQGAYNASTGQVEFITSHLSKYAVGYNKVTFSDVANNAWYYNAVTFIAARNITTGISSEIFSPNSYLTRGQFIVMLMRAYGITPDETAADNFSDAGNDYYTKYLSAAKRLGIATGMDDNNFGPNLEISRQDMFTLIFRALSLLNMLPTTISGNTLGSFSDAGQIRDYAQAAVKALVESGKVNGMDGLINPYGNSTRAEMAQLLCNLLSKS